MIPDVDQGLDLERFKNLYWSRVIVLQDHLPGEQMRWPLVEEIRDNREVLAMVDQQQDPELIFDHAGVQLDEVAWHLHFDPQAFSEQHGELKLDAYRLSEEQLHAQGVEVSKLRGQIEFKADATGLFNNQAFQAIQAENLFGDQPGEEEQ